MTEREQVGADDRTLEKVGLLLETKQYTTAATLAGAFLTAHPSDPDALVALGRAQRGLGDHAAAIDCFGRALGVDPAHYAASVWLAGEFSEVGRHADALRTARALVRAYPDVAGSHFMLSSVALETGNKRLANEAMIAARTAVVLDPEVPEYHVNLGLAAHRSGDLRLAREATGQALRLDPNNAAALNNRGLMMKRFRSGRRAAEIDTYSRAAALDPLDSVARYNLEVVVYNTLARTGWYIALPMIAAIITSVLASRPTGGPLSSALVPAAVGCVLVVALWGGWVWFNVRRIPVDRRGVLRAVARSSGPIRAIGSSLGVFALATVAVIPLSITVTGLGAALFPLLIVHRIVEYTSRAMLRRRHPDRC
ncbi:TPR repeat-containing protein OS=Tsukamurella paurometabola (strain ATCC 8368 / DSM / CCUG 35730/ CIP 100753 / JCM 10117 / KCTC 9821 / NBRC 16120 / NCIMB 702349 / NCTC 13040) OX=521096 GN=Tpau_1753 PE=4 SV=1 [Tsukamurella paurometabola]|uniref:TPR repeat-containing protein n=1 Tax=Tsukamurella paurometabola (strain ATCC 8368 / DSM 20162 / CCUG 35730 / CIP 100753 / JCM 10117 / KCTC 9821 / NBRC 16120 / NCIMB 702349 / NCTC 13040) TaxID=521096 RepID=D5UM91_TSUPD|nr:tetratricopeptide repeat protein [Tsukamurella paurometabola]ADG78371.1 TPR repeat-containing protein [Tsukamurella paurometabola DSM 20162]SUP31386.1 Predicted O-linked N-acetylglucosamine transferase, SPINDLY family [Tsukamurella paurometabola]